MDGSSQNGKPSPSQLRVEYETTPANVPIETPRFSWRIEDEFGTGQQAYRILVARSVDALTSRQGDCWDSGRVSSERSVGVTYDGVSLKNNRTYYWTVRLWNDNGEASDFAEPTTFSTALSTGGWDADWITHQPGGGDANGFRTEWRQPSADSSEWVQLDLGTHVQIDRIVLHPASPFDGPTTPDGAQVSSLYAGGQREDHPITVRGAAGFGFPRRYRIEVSSDPGFEDATVVVDHSEAPVANPGTDAVSLDVTETGRYVRVTVVEPYVFDPTSPPQNYHATRYDELREDHREWATFALAGIRVFDDTGTDQSLDAHVDASSSMENNVWGRRYLIDERTTSVITSPSPLLRTEVFLREDVRTARAHVAVGGYGELYVNGETVGRRVLDPSWTKYEERTLYSTYDLSENLSEGKNAIGLWLGRGWFSRNDYEWTGNGSPRARLRLDIEYEDGTTRTVTTNDSWLATESPILENDVYDGEVYDARREHTGWTMPDYDASDWDLATVVSGPAGSLEPQQIEPIRNTETFDPELFDRRGDGAVYDVGQNITGRIELTIRDPDAGEQITLRHAEAITDDGELSAEDLRSADATDVYITRGDDEEVYEPRFTYHGFRYVEVSGISPDAVTITARVYHTDMRNVGSFACSNEELNAVQHAAEWSLRGNAFALPTGCAQRDERTGWTGDAQLSARALLYNFDSIRFYEKWMKDHDDEQSIHGCIPDVVPHVHGTKPGDPSWTVTRVVIPWFVYRFYGDDRILERHYQAMCEYVEYWDRRTEDDLLPAKNGNYGDWLAFENTREDSPVGEPLELFNTASHYWVTDTIADIASVLGNNADAKRYRGRADAIAGAFNEEFLSKNDVYRPGTQAAYAIPLSLGIVPPDRVDAVVDNLVSKVRSDGNRLMTGFLGTRALLDALVEYDHAELAYDLVAQPEQPGWVYMIQQGATTLWERWDSDGQVGSGMNSYNHHQFAYVSEWFFSTLAGIDLVDHDDGSTVIEIAPTLVADLDWAAGERETPHGQIRSRWERTDSGYELRTEIPWNADGRVRIPLPETTASVRTQGIALSEADSDPLPDGIIDICRNTDTLVLDIQAGTYTFTVSE